MEIGFLFFLSLALSLAEEVQPAITTQRGFFSLVFLRVMHQNHEIMTQVLTTAKPDSKTILSFGIQIQNEEERRKKCAPLPSV